MSNSTDVRVTPLSSAATLMDFNTALIVKPMPPPVIAKFARVPMLAIVGVVPNAWNDTLPCENANNPVALRMLFSPPYVHDKPVISVKLTEFQLAEMPVEYVATGALPWDQLTTRNVTLPRITSLTASVREDDCTVATALTDAPPEMESVPLVPPASWPVPM